MQKKIGIALVCLAYLSGGHQIGAQEPLRGREVNNLVREYVSSATENERQAEIVNILGKSKTILAQNAIRSSLGKESTRAQALDLAISLRIPGLFKYVRKYLSGDLDDRIIELVFVSKDNTGTIYLANLWTKVDEDSATYNLINDGFMNHFIGQTKVVDKFQKALSSSSETRRVDAAAIIAFQLGLDETDPGEIKTKWKSLRKEFLADAKYFAIRGTPLFKTQIWNLAGYMQVGNNIVLEPSGYSILNPLPDHLQKGNFTLTARVRIKHGTGTVLSFGLDWNGNERAWRPEYRDGEWILQEGTGVQFAVPVRVGDWAEIKFVVTDLSNEGAPGRRQDRRLKILVNGKVLLSNGLANGILSHFGIEAGNSEVVISGVESN